MDVFVILLHPIDNLRNLLSLARGDVTNVQVKRLLVEGVNPIRISEQFHHRIGNVQVTLFGEDFLDVLFPELDNETNEIRHLLMGVVLVIGLQLDSMLVPVLTYLHILIELLVVGVVEKYEVMLGDDGKVCESLGLLLGVFLTTAGRVILVHVGHKMGETFLLNVLRTSLEIRELEGIEDVLYELLERLEDFLPKDLLPNGGVFGLVVQNDSVLSLLSEIHS